MPASRPSSFSLVSAGPVQLFSTEELLRLPEPHWLINRILPAGGLIALYGPSGVGKSFITLDMALSIAVGIPWQGRATEKGLVVYISAEGAAGLGQRVKAWLDAHGLEPSDTDIAWVTEAVPIFVDSEYLEVLFNRFDELQRMPTLVVVDTLARCYSGNENETEDMNNFVAGLDRFRHECGSSVLVVHHTNVSEGRERGNTAFRAATETMISVLPGVGGLNASTAARKQRDAFTISCSKQKDAMGFPNAAGRLIPTGKSATIKLVWDEPDDYGG